MAAHHPGLKRGRFLATLLAGETVREAP